MAEFIYVLCAFGLIALVPILGIAGFAIAGGAGAIGGAVIGMFLLIWAACYFMNH